MTEGFLQNDLTIPPSCLRQPTSIYTREAEDAAVCNPQKLVATASRREGVYNQTGEPSVIFAEKEELHSE